MTLRKQIEEKVLARQKLVQSIQNDIKALSTKIKKLQDENLEIYKMLVKPDSLFNDCPLSPFFTAHHIKQFMIKCDMDFIGYCIDGKHSIKDLTDLAKELVGWVYRFSEEPKPEKKGIDAIV